MHGMSIRYIRLHNFYVDTGPAKSIQFSLPRRDRVERTGDKDEAACTLTTEPLSYFESKAAHSAGEQIAGMLVEALSGFNNRGRKSLRWL
jgi:hypothetical protein